MSSRPKLRMTNADYVAIAISPALIMALVGSLVFFLIEILYVGQYHARLNYAFAWFVFATVLIGRIAIEMGSERAAMYALPLGLAMFAVMAKFVPQAGGISHLINLGLLGLVWWSAHKLTWDCTLIDDNEDSSGEGLMQHLAAAPTGDTDNELLARETDEKKKRRHAPGLWVLYFSLAALPLFGIGQKWIPAADVGRRQYAFGLLAVYVAAGLALLVTTSFLGLRRYLRQRRIEMPTPMAGTWVVTGALLIVATMLLAAVIPRPQAEYAISQVPWQADSPTELTASRTNFGDEGTDDANAQGRKVTNDQTDPNAQSQRPGDEPTSSSDEGEKQSSGSEGDSQAQNDSSKQEKQQGENASNDDAQSSQSENTSESAAEQTQSKSDQPSERSETSSANESESDEQTQDANAANPTPENAGEGSSPPRSLTDLIPQLSGLANLAKWVLYAAIALAALFIGWRRRHEIARAIADFVRDIRKLLEKLFGRRQAKPTRDTDDNEEQKLADEPTRPFAVYADPFAAGNARSLPPDELVRYTFEAFEAWARERGHTRSPDQTPLELVRRAVPNHSPLYTEARVLAELYNEAAYAPRSLTPAAVEKLARLWTLMQQSAQTPLEPIS